jgi:ProP effector
MKAKLRRKHEAADETISKLAQLYPRTFFVYEQRRRPLVIGVHNALVAHIPQPALCNALRHYTGNNFYLRALQAGAVRIDLQGQPAGTVTAAEAAQAQLRLATRKQSTPRSKQQLVTTALASWQAHKQKPQRKSNIRVWRN